ncbi:MAG: TldD/PmbA family protein [Chlorobi bacterium]|nr:TldD/PmbA family protein [Chlorobiota bacterium]MCI0714725.1 TldD/PmbA family protein [Chlorobiota bacterium]
MILNENEAKNLLTKILSYSKADSISATLTGSNTFNLRFALNSLTTNGFSDGLNVSVTSDIGKKSGNVSINKFDDKSIKEAVEKSEEIAKLCPDNLEFMPPLGAQEYLKAINYSQETEKLNHTNRAAHLAYIIQKSLEKGVVSAGYFEDGLSFTAVMTSNGLFAYNKNTGCNFSATVRSEDGTGSSRVEKSYVNVKDLNSKRLTDIAIQKCKVSAKPAELKPGRYTVILEPAAAADMIALALNFMGARAADEGRSFFTKKGGGNKIGEKLVGDKVTIYSDPSDPKSPSIPFTSEGYPRTRIVWFENGVLANLHRPRFWAKEKGAQVVPYPSNLIMQGGTKSLKQLVSETESAILITRFWYIRTVERKTMLLTGLTRDGLFEIKDGKIYRSVKNFRFNESPIGVLSNLIDFGKAEKAVGSENETLQIFVPPLKVNDFNFSSLSDAI